MLLEPAGWGRPPSQYLRVLLPPRAWVGKGREGKLGLVFCVGFGCSAFAVVSFALVVGSGLSAWRWFRLSDIWVRVCFGLSRLALVCPFAFVVGFGRSACAVVSFHFVLGSAPRVGRPSRNFAKKFEVRVVCLPCVNSVPRIPAVKSGWPAL